MSVSWVIDQYMLDLSRERGCGSIADAVQRSGMQAHVVSAGNAVSQDISLPKIEAPCVVVYGSFRFVRRLERQLRSSGQAPYLPGAFANIANLSYSAFGAHIGDLLLNDDFVVLPFAEFKRRRLSLWGDRCFLRPDAVTKSFTGMVVTKEDFDHEMNALEKLQHVAPEDLVVAAAVRDIVQETRFVIVDGKVITGSTYGWNGNEDIGKPIDGASLEMAQEVAARGWQPDRAYTCDIALVTDAGNLSARVIELNSFSCAGLYACDLDLTVSAVSAAAMDELQECFAMV